MALSLIDFQTIPFNAQTTPRSTAATLAWNSGDLFIVMGGCADSGSGRNLSTPSMTGLTFSLIGSALSGASHCWGAAWQATAGSSGSDDCGSSQGGTSIEWGLAVAQFRGASGVGGTASLQSDNFQVSNTNTGTNSMVVWYGFDWDASAAGVTLTPSTNRTERTDEQVSPSTWSIYGGTWTGQSAGATTYGIDTNHGERLTQFAVEVLAAAEVGPPPAPRGIPVVSGVRLA